MANVSAAPRRLIGGMTREARAVIFASSLGTIFEWYDFYLYVSLAATIGKVFFSGVNPAASYIFALLAFAAGFAVRPFGALVFGRVGDLVGRKYAFLITIAIMGLSSFLVGLLPGYAAIGLAAPVILILLRLLQALALGGEYGGAVVYVAEHAPHGKRGLYTSWIQTAATLGLFVSLLVILGCRQTIGARSFEEWGWRIPFLISIVLLAISVYIRRHLDESPLFERIKAEGGISRAPLTESFAERGNLKLVLLALFGGTAGQAVVWYTGQLYTLFFLTQTLKVDPATAILMTTAALAIATPGFIFCGWLSDRVGRKKIIMLGCLLAVITYLPLFKAITHYANPALEAAVGSAPVIVVANPAKCSLQFDPVGTSKFSSSCDVAKSALVTRGIPYTNQTAPAGGTAQVKVGQTVIPSYDAKAPDATTKAAAFTKSLTGALKSAGYPAKADPAEIDLGMVITLLVILVVFATMVYGPLAAMLVEMFPTRIRYTSVSLPYHIGNGWFGGLLPAIAFAIAASTGNIYDGLWYPIAIAAMTMVVGVLFLRETKNTDIQEA
ncbi:MAG TPA: MFS transporter [Stellaceae bacterium]|nr:MFS transporter [Stellaceae bacterium]